MAGGLKNKLKLLRGRLPRKIVFWVFLSVIVIETIIFIPSFRKRQLELLAQLKAVSAAKVAMVLQLSPPQISHTDLLAQLRKLQMHRGILGGALYGRDGRLLGTFGEAPELAFKPMRPGQMGGQIFEDGRRYDVICSPAWHDADYTIILRHDTAPVRAELYAFFRRIAGLVIIISVFVTIGAWLALDPIVVTPILRLRQDLIAAGEAISQNRSAPEFYAASVHRKDELGEVIAAFREMYSRITDAISKRNAAEKALQKSFEKVASYSRALNKELEQGREMQKNFLPARLASPPGWEIEAFFRPARQVSGDFYDVFTLPDGSFCLVIADVCDKGVGAALFMALFRSLIRVYTDQVCREVLSQAESAASGIHGRQVNACILHDHVLKPIELTNNYIARHHGDLGMFATIFFGVLDPVSGRLTYVNGGHLPLVITSPGEGVRQQLRATAPAVGILPDLDFAPRTTHIKPGEFLFGCTDGVTEASSADGKFFSLKRLIRILGTPPASAKQLVETVAAQVTQHTGENDQFDDITMIALRYLP